jgi:hypothetical protein
MEFKNYKTLSNAELNLYLKTLENEFEHLKVEIEEKCKYLESLDKEYGRAMFELDSRKNYIK